MSLIRIKGLGASRYSLLAVVFCLCAIICASCAGRAASTSGTATPRVAVKQVLVLPDVGVADLDTLDPAQGTDQNSILAMQMIYSGLVRQDQNLQVQADQATWTISGDRKVYTFYLKAGLFFSDGTAITAQTYVYTLTRALLPAVQSDNAMLFFGNIVGAADVNSGKTSTLSGVRAVDASTLTITLVQPTDYLLYALANPIAFPLNQQVIERYGEANWSDHIVGNAVGSGPFIVKQWEHNARMVLVPDPYYAGQHTRLTEVDLIFISDPHTAFQTYQGGQYSLVWGMPTTDFSAARGLAGFMSQSLLQTDVLFFNTQIPPFNQTAMRQAFAYATDKNLIAQAVFNNSVVPAPTIIPAGVPGYLPDLHVLAYDRSKAQSLIQQAYPDVTQLPTITFSYPNSLVSPMLARALQQMWQSALGIPIRLLSVETNAYDIEMANHQIQLGFTQWSADFPDPYDVLAMNLLSTAPANAGNWASSQFDQAVQQAEQTSGASRLTLYAQAEQDVLSDVGWLPLDHQIFSAVIPAMVHGISLNHMGFYFGDWSGVYLTAR